MNLFLHIGGEKTGSTSIQKSLLSNREKLNEMSVLVPRSLIGWGQHAKLYTFVKDSQYTDDFLTYCGLGDRVSRGLAITQWKDEFRNEVLNSRAGSCVISSELLQSRVCSEAEVGQLSMILRETFTAIKIIIYLRDPLRLAISFISTALRSGFAVEKFPLPGDDAFHRMGLDIKVNHERALKLWKSAFPHADFSIRVFEKGCLADGCVVSDFQRQCQLPGDKLSSHEPVNTSLSMSGAAILSSLNKIYPRIDSDSLYNHERDKLLGLIDAQMQSGSPLLPTSDTAKVYADCYESSNEWVRRTYFPDKPSLFTAYSGPFSPSDTFSVDPRDVDSIARLILAVASDRQPPISHQVRIKPSFI